MAFLKAQAALTKFKTQYNYWIKFSVIFLILLISTFIEWKYLVDLRFVIMGFFTLIAAGWWYWTMFLVKTLVDQRQEEIKILNDVIADLKDIKNNLTNLDK